MIMKKITDKEFKKYGRIIENINFTELIEELQKTPNSETTIYEPSVKTLEEISVTVEIQKKIYGGMPIQIGYCNGKNHLLNAFEYHCCSEINFAGTDAVLILGMRQDITNECTYDTSLAEAFYIPKGYAVELYATTLHYAPCSVKNNQFKMGIVLLRDTNYPLEEEEREDKMVTAKNKWLLGHPEAKLPKGTRLGLLGENLSVGDQ